VGPTGPHRPGPVCLSVGLPGATERGGVSPRLLEKRFQTLAQFCKVKAGNRRVEMMLQVIGQLQELTQEVDNLEAKDGNRKQSLVPLPEDR
jgi:hypothetical protein